MGGVSRHLAGLSALSDVGADMAVAAATSARVCVRPHVRSVTDMVSGQSTAVPIACGSTREAVCPTCSEKARRLRMHQCREGWHRTDEPEMRSPDEGEADEVGEDDLVEDEAMDGADDESGQERARTVRSTRRIGGFPDLPTVPMDQRTTGREFTDSRTGRVFQPSMFVTLTLPSYGKVVPGRGVPVDPSRYDYRRAALDAMLFPRLLDRFWQNLRRCAGYKVQYFSAVEAQRRLAPHVHAAVRGAIPRATIKAVARATYHAAWWPSVDRVVYQGEQRPVWDEGAQGYVDPQTGEMLPTWDEATALLDEPAHVVSFGAQVDIKGLLGGTDDSDRAVRYLCKYLTKAIADTYSGQHDGQRPVDEGYERHIDRLEEEVRWLPCTPACGNWLRFGVQPKDAGRGWCRGCAAHRRTTGRTSAWVVVGSWCLGSGRVRHWRAPRGPARGRGPGAGGRGDRPRPGRPDGRRQGRPARWAAPLRVAGRRGRRGRLRRGHRRVPSSGQGLAGTVRASQGACRAARITACGFCFGNG